MVAFVLLGSTVSKFVMITLNHLANAPYIDLDLVHFARKNQFSSNAKE